MARIEELAAKINEARRLRKYAKLKALPIALPPLAEQWRVVAELEALEFHLRVLKKLQTESATELDAMLPSILDKAFKGDL